jgi:hypothetical protein|tara:strand:- start:2984 stop:3172 length:189 start_codon:yes stop_codon:yes gene_type:complete
MTWLKSTAIFAAGIITTVSISLFIYDMRNGEGVNLIHYLMPFSVGMILSALLMLTYLDSDTQ